jgi:hypothetical protein
MLWLLFGVSVLIGFLLEFENYWEDILEPVHG